MKKYKDDKGEDMYIRVGDVSMISERREFITYKGDGLIDENTPTTIRCGVQIGPHSCWLPFYDKGEYDRFLADCIEV